ncbi:glycosyltransferase family 4 protein [Francisella sp. Scap27]|uniref:glycosyltransferase family 4 protein n=1 Tax=Francisella sp. Scap27 TaxID=2589986 RepID=UPI0015BC9F69|nr:glycosyltransferase family 4 protein [Francisella sp. Scap27]QLE78519.1 glycosyltransferase family 4 protein [Francisella sp. Scap27]
MNIVIIDHYATRAFVGKGGRQYYFARELAKKGHNVKVVCSNVDHHSDYIVNTNKNIIKTLQDDNGNDWIFVNTLKYKPVQSKRRWLNVLDFYFKLFFRYKKIIPKNADVIIASSGPISTLHVGLHIAKKMKIPCVCEVRDLWPLSIVEYTSLTDKNLIIKALYRLEKWCYKKSAAIVFTVEGGKQYIIDKGWSNNINLEKVNYINNGVCLETFRENKEKYVFNDKDLDAPDVFKVVYTGTISKVNKIEELVKVAEQLENKKVKIIIFGEGSEEDGLKKYCLSKSLGNIVFKGRVDKKYIPSIISKADLNIVIIDDKPNLYKYGISMNKLFEYLASARPIMLTNPAEDYNFVVEEGCGVNVYPLSTNNIIKAVKEIYLLDTPTKKSYISNSLHQANSFDFKNHAEKLENILIKVKNKYES